MQICTIVSLLANVSLILTITLPIVALIVGALATWLIIYFVNKKKVTDAKQSADKIVQDANIEAKNLKKEAILEAKEEVHRLRSECDRELKDRRNEAQRVETRILQKEEMLDKKDDMLSKRSESLEAYKNQLTHKENELKKKQGQVDSAYENMVSELEKIANLSRDEAKTMLIANIEEEARKDAAVMVRNIEREAKETADKKAKELVTLAIQKCATDHASETTVSVVALPNDDMKGRIIGREGRNIRALENATGIDLIIDDTPEVVILSGFDPIRREITRIALEKLITDGRIHPARIEEVVEKVTKEVNTQIKEAGESAMFDAGIYGLHPELIKLLGRLKYRTSYGQNVLNHSLEVSHLAGIMASELGVDVKLAKRAGLLHDIGKAVDHEVEGTHIQIGANLAKKYKESKLVVNAIMAHHGDVEPESVEAILVQAADAISGSRPGARRESLENYIQRLEKLEEIANSFAGIEKSFAMQAGREIRIIVKPEEVDDSKVVFLAKDIAKKVESEMEYPGQIKINVIRETRSIEYAK